MLDTILKAALPLVAPKMDSLDPMLLAFLQEQQHKKQEDETHVTVVLDVDNGKVFFNVAAFKGSQYVRSIERVGAVEFVKNLIGL